MKNANIIITVFLTLFSGFVSAATIALDTPASNVNVNDVFTINVIGTGFNSNVDGGGLNISFDQSVLNILSVSIDESVWDFSGFGISTGTINNTAGSVDGIMVNTFKNVAGDFTVATIEVQAIAAGNSILSLSEFALNPWASGGSLINPDFIGGDISVNAAVPVPMASWLFLSGLFGLAAIAKRKVHT